MAHRTRGADWAAETGTQAGWRQHHLCAYCVCLAFTLVLCDCLVYSFFFLLLSLPLQSFAFLQLLRVYLPVIMCGERTHNAV